MASNLCFYSLEYQDFISQVYFMHFTYVVHETMRIG